MLELIASELDWIGVLRQAFVELLRMGRYVGVGDWPRPLVNLVLINVLGLGKPRSEGWLGHLRLETVALVGSRGMEVEARVVAPLLPPLRVNCELLEGHLASLLHASFVLSQQLSYYRLLGLGRKEEALLGAAHISVVVLFAGGALARGLVHFLGRGDIRVKGAHDEWRLRELHFFLVVVWSFVSQVLFPEQQLPVHLQGLSLARFHVAIIRNRLQNGT